MTLPQEDDAWPREGPVRLLASGRWRRKNGPVACDVCRKRRVRCSGFETGAPCDSCRRRGTSCKIGDDTYPCDADEQTTIFVPILPPPAVPCSSPSGSEDGAEELDVELLCDMLEESIPRPAPLVWKMSPDDTLLTTSGTTTRQREKRLLPPSSAASTSQSAKRTLEDDSSETDDDPPHPPPRLAKKRKVPALRIEVPPVQHEDGVVEAAMALYSLKSGGLVSVGEWKTAERKDEVKRMKSSAALPALPISSSREDPLPPPSRGPSQQTQPSFPPRLFAPTTTSSLFQPPLFPLNLAASSSTSRRASLASSTSTSTSASAGAAFFYGGGVVVSAEGSVTSAEEDELRVVEAVEDGKRAV